MPEFKNSLPIRLSSPIPSATFEISDPTFSQMLAISLINEIFVARKELAAYLIISALVRSVVTTGIFRPLGTDLGMSGGQSKLCSMRGLYSLSINFIAFVDADPMTILSGKKVSLTALPSRINSGFDTTLNRQFLLPLLFSMLSDNDHGNPVSGSYRDGTLVDDDLIGIYIFSDI